MNQTTPTGTEAGFDLDLAKLASIADRVDARGLFNAACDIRDWIQEVHAALARRAAPATSGSASGEKCGDCKGKGQTRIHARPGSWRTCGACEGSGRASLAPVSAQQTVDPEGPIAARLLGRAKFLRAKGEHKSAALMEEAAARIPEVSAQQTELDEQQWIDRLSYDAQVDEWAIMEDNYEAEIVRLRAAVSAQQARIEAKDREGIVLTCQVHELLNHCPDTECTTCGEIICPHACSLHFHHDGCPACAEHEAETPDQSEASRSVATVRVTNEGYAMELSTYIAYALPEGMHELYAAPEAMTSEQQPATQQNRDTQRIEFLIANPRWSVRWRLKNGREQWQMVDDGESWGQWGAYRAVIDYAMSAHQAKKGQTNG